MSPRNISLWVESMVRSEKEISLQELSGEAVLRKWFCYLAFFTLYVICNI